MIKNRKMLVYIAGPLTVGDLEDNIAVSMRIASKLIREGYNVILPHLNMFLQRFWEEDSDEYDDLLAWGREEWLDFDFAQLEKCDALYRIAGESPGADWEVSFCKGRRIPVATGMGDLKFIKKEWEKQYAK